MIVPAYPRRYSREEYFKLAEASPTKLEFKAGQIIAMAGALLDHNRIASNLVREIGNRLAGGPCEVVGSDQRVWTADDRYCYPDVTVFCGGPVYDPADPNMSLTNPQIVIEILSPKTEATDRSEKLVRYINLPSLREYVLVAQDRPRVEAFFRSNDGRWEITETEGLDAEARFVSAGLAIPMRHIYLNVSFESRPPVP